MNAPSPGSLIINADDFGYSPEVNAAVLRAFTEGVLTSASLMVAEAAWQGAVNDALSHSGLGVGLHLVTTFDRSVLPASRIPQIVDIHGKFGSDPVRTGLLYSFSSRARSQLRAEIEAQFDRFAASGLPWSHVDGHQHFHMHPAVWDNLLDCCDSHGVHRLRVPHEELRAHLAADGDGPNLNTAATLALRAMRRRNLRVLRARGTLGGRKPFLCDRVYGQLNTGNMNSAYTQGLIRRVTGQTVEIYFHPGAPHARALPEAERERGISDVELQALLSPEVRTAIQTSGRMLCTYAEAEKNFGAAGAHTEH